MRLLQCWRLLYIYLWADNQTIVIIILIVIIGRVCGFGLILIIINVKFRKREEGIN